MLHESWIRLPSLAILLISQTSRPDVNTLFGTCKLYCPLDDSAWRDAFTD